MTTHSFGKIHGILSDFTRVRPNQELPQEATLEWLAGAYARAEALAQGRPGPDPERIATFRKLLQRFGCSPEQIRTRGVEALDFYDQGGGMLARTRRFAELARGALEVMYPSPDSPPSHLIHVTCTGYVSPSAAQELVDSRGWNGKVGITHAYHMGCYASIPAIRIAAGQLALRPRARVDIVHTEICSLHLNPADHAPEQLVVQSLFGDGHIRYSLRPDASRGLELLGLHELIVPGTRSSMSWISSDWGMKMTLARDVPRQVAGSISPFLSELLEPCGLSAAEATDAAIFAIHPGGPKIIDSIREQLGLHDEQVRHSREVLRDHGNMSSATLPHVWKAILEDPSVPSGKPVVSLAFGPGLTVFGTLLRKRA